jgi:anaerobic ribonucleoside-triphosphate reductase
MPEDIVAPTDSDYYVCPHCGYYIEDVLTDCSYTCPHCGSCVGADRFNQNLEKWLEQERAKK